ncbi:hypothetical protein JE950_002367 [Flavobacterium psychrophilum]|nr:hypothetical protein [Flavobacterium psychrophilum]
MKVTIENFIKTFPETELREGTVRVASNTHYQLMEWSSLYPEKCKIWVKHSQNTGQHKSWMIPLNGDFTFNEIARCRDIINKTLFENPECSDYLLHVIIEDSLREYR